MKTAKIPILAWVTALLLATILITGCKNTGSDSYKQSMKTSDSLMAAADQIQEGTVLIDAVLASLNGIVESPGTDLPQQFLDFQSELNDLSKTAESVSKKAQKMFEQGDSYFQAWSEQLATIQNTDIRAQGESRKEEVAAAFDKVAAQYQELSASFNPFMSDLRDIEAYLGTDLTLGGIEAIDDTVKDAIKKGKEVQEDITALADQFRSMGLKLSPAGTGS